MGNIDQFQCLVKPCGESGVEIDEIIFPCPHRGSHGYNTTIRMMHAIFPFA